jgi:hypothetical protein
MAIELKRRRDWEPRLVTYLSLVAKRPFVPGKHDCALFVAGAIRVMTGHDFARGYRSTYRSLRGGLKALKAQGLADHVAVAEAFLPEVATAFARRGDVAVVPGDDGIGALGIVQGEGIYVAGSEGLSMVPRHKMVRAFRI